MTKQFADSVTRMPTIGWVLAGLLALLTGIMHGGALQGFWRYDDPMVLLYVLEHPQAAGYFLSPQQWQALGVPFFTPWLILDYWLDHRAFGMNPAMFYVHHLAVVWLCATLTFILLYRPAGPYWSGVTAAVFLIGAPTSVIAQQLMARHYATGLLFTILAIMLWLRHDQNDSRKSLALSMLCYLLAALNKEVFAPLPLLLLCLGKKPLATRLRAMLPMALAALAYLAWRTLMLGKVVGGYRDSLSITSALANSIATLPKVMFGTGWATSAAGLLMLMATLSLLRSSRRNGHTIAASAICLALPFLAVQPSLQTTELRFSFLPWWAACVLLGLGLSRPWLKMRGGTDAIRYLPPLAALVIAGLSIHQAIDSARDHDAIANQFDVTGRFIWQHDDSDKYVPYDQIANFPSFQYPIVALKGRLRDETAPAPVPFADVAHADTLTGAVYSYDSGCRCMKEMPSASTSQDTLRFDPEQPMSIRVTRGASDLAWEMEAPAGGSCFFVFQNIKTSISVPCLAKIHFSPPSWLGGKFRFVVRTPNRRWNTSPLLSFPGVEAALAWKSPVTP